jgi:hypothetical protein
MLFKFGDAHAMDSKRNSNWHIAEQTWKVLGTTAAMIDLTLTTDFGSRYNLGREIDDAVLLLGQEICMKNLDSPGYSRRRSRKSFRRSDGGTQIA